MSSNKEFFTTLLSDRALLSVQGADAYEFLQALITNDLNKLKSDDGIIYACLLTPQGKYLNDFFIFKDREAEGGYLIDCHKDASNVLLKRFAMYKMRSDVVFKQKDDFQCFGIWGDEIEVCVGGYEFNDPRNSDMGTRIWQNTDLEVNTTLKDYHRHRIKAGIPEGVLDIRPSLGGMQENNIDILSGLSFDKGCYLGQETVARIHYRGLVKKRLFPFFAYQDTDAEISVEDDVYLKIDDKTSKIGTVRCFDGKYGLALIKIASFPEKEVDCTVQISENNVTLYQPEYLKVFLQK